VRIGLSYDLREEYIAQGYSAEQTAEFDAGDTVSAIADVIERRGHQTVLIGNLFQLAERLVAGERWDLVFNFAEGLHGLSREAQVPALLDGYEVPYVFSDPLTLTLTLDKGMAKRVVRDHGLPTPGFAVVESVTDLPRIDLEFPVFAKPLAEGSGKGISASSWIADREALSRACQDLMARFRQPVLLEHYLPGREFTVGLLGNGHDARVIGAMEVDFTAQAEAHGYSYENKEHYENRVRYRLVHDAEAQAAADVALGAWKTLRCRDAGRVDLRSDGAGQPQFLEVNPLAGLHPVRSDLVILARLAGYDYAWLIGGILDVACARLGLAVK
jgi:D-alanine-D-alanine ligase